MLINDKKIIDLIKEESLVVEPIDIDHQIGPFTVSLGIGTQFVIIGETAEVSSAEIGDPIIIKPYTSISIVSLETIKLPTYLSGAINLMSHWEKIGLWMNSPFVDPGFRGKLVFNLSNISPQPIQLFAGLRIVLLALFQLEAHIDYYRTKKYTMEIQPSFSKLYKDQELVELRNFIAHSAEKIKVKPKTKTNFGELLDYLLTATNAQEKGKLLERFLEEILCTIKGLKILKVSARLRAEEIDIIAQNTVSEGFWRTLGSPIIVECKNWTKKVGSKEISILSDKMKSISPDVKLGILVAPNGVTGDYQSDGVLKIREKRQQGLYIIVLIKEDLEEIASGTHTSMVIEKKYDKLFLI